MLLADHLVVLNEGRVVQAGLPLELYRRPETPFVASFLGEANLVEVTMEECDGQPVRSPFGKLPFPPGVTRGWVLVRPEDVTEDPGGCHATVADCRGLGPHDRVVLQLADGTEVLAHFPPEMAPIPGSKVRIGVRSRKPHFVPDSGTRT
jgi:ABC-type Fe3+/spermidine/putrescine transport system ATPase subunit